MEMSNKTRGLTGLVKASLLSGAAFLGASFFPGIDGNNFWDDLELDRAYSLIAPKVEDTKSQCITRSLQYFEANQEEIIEGSELYNRCIELALLKSARTYGVEEIIFGDDLLQEVETRFVGERIPNFYRELLDEEKSL